MVIKSMRRVDKVERRDDALLYMLNRFFTIFSVKVGYYLIMCGSRISLEIRNTVKTRSFGTLNIRRGM